VPIVLVHRDVYSDDYIVPAIDTQEIVTIFSGPNIPPELTTWRNQVLVWFGTDGKNQGKGWKAQYRFQDL